MRIKLLTAVFDDHRMMDPIVLYYGKGQLTGFLVDPKGVLDVVSTLETCLRNIYGLYISNNHAKCSI